MPDADLHPRTNVPRPPPANYVWLPTPRDPVLSSFPRVRPSPAHAIKWKYGTSTPRPPATPSAATHRPRLASSPALAPFRVPSPSDVPIPWPLPAALKPILGHLIHRNSPSPSIASFSPSPTRPTPASVSSTMPKAAAPKAKSGDAKKVKAVKDANKPKRALSAYMFFVQDYRERIKTENPDASFGEVGKLLGAKWKEMGSSEKKPYEQQAEKDKTRAAKAKTEYEAGQGKPAKKTASKPVVDDDEDDDEDDE